MSGGAGFLASVGALSGARIATMAGQIFILPLLARYLAPAEFGVAALATSVVVFANIFSDAGMGRSLIRTSLDLRDEWSSVFWLLCGVGVGLALASLALVPAAVWFFEEPALAGPLAAMSALPFILSMNAPFAAEMEQRRAFAELALSQTVASLVSMAATVAMAMAGFGVWALVAQQLLQFGLRALWVTVRSRFRPGLVFSRRALGPHFTFGRDITAASLVGYLGQQSTTLVLGKALGAADLGLFSMTQRFSRLPMFGLAGPFGQVLYVRLSGVAGDGEAFRGVVLAAMRLLGFAALPPMAALAMVGDVAFPLLLSDRWAPVAPIFAAIALGAGLQAATYPTTIALTALGQTGRRLRLTTEVNLLWLLMLVAAAPFGLTAVAAAQTLWMAAQAPLHWRALRRACGIGARAFLGALAPGLAAAGAAAAVLLAAKAIFAPGGWTWLFIATGLSGLVFAVAALSLRSSLRRDLRRLRG